jgi:hypothetical protein
MLFLGAGASNAVGIGHLSILTKKIIKELNKTRYSYVIDEIITGLNQKNKNNLYYKSKEIDIEIILSILNRCTNPKESLKNLGPYAIFCSQENNTIFSIDKSDLKEIYKMIDNIITNHCIKYNKDLAFNIYNELLSIDNKIVDYKLANSTTNQRLFSNIVTLNYDLVLEQVYKQLGKGLTVGMKKEPDGDDFFIDLENILLSKQHPNELIQYLKLHGSIDWRVRDRDGKIVRRETGESFSGDTATQQLMIYPIFDKDISNEFYFTFYYQFKKILLYHDIYLVIGYSFRDHSINNAFYQGLNNNPKSRMIIVTTNQSVINRINMTFKRYSDRLSIIKNRFGEEKLLDDLMNVLE